MKQILFLLFLLAGTYYAQAQDQCGTEMTNEVQAWLDNRQNNLQQFARKGTAVLYVPVHIHIVGNDNGAGYFNKANAYNVVCELNQHFAPMDIVFFLEGAISYINNSNYTNPTLPYTNQMMNNNNVADVCNIYFVPQLTGLCGYAYFPNSGPDMGRGGVVLKNACALPHNTDPTHELGHYFSLPHTFQDWNSPNAELVNGSNCATKGDRFCDTRADYLDNRWNCPYTGTFTDANGDRYRPDSSLYMSYSNTPCASRFSPMQQNAITYTRTVDRSYLGNTAVPSLSTLSPTILLTPADNDANVPSANNARFSWNKVPGAIEYNLRIKLAATASFENSVFNVVTTDTFAYINGLTVGATYNWKSLPLSYGQTCVYCDSSLSAAATFSVIYSVHVEERDETVNNMAILPNPVNGNCFLQLTARTGGEAILNITNTNGELVFSGTITIVPGENNIPLSTEKLNNGVYVVTVLTKDYRAHKKLIKIAQ